jgi:hypothetical protein
MTLSGRLFIAGLVAGGGSLRASSHEAPGYTSDYRTKFVKNQ